MDPLAGQDRPSRWRRIAWQATDLLFPRWCTQCHGSVEGSDYHHLCRHCGDELVVVQPPACTTCGHPFFGLLSGDRACVHCAELEPVFDAGKTLLLMRGPAREMIHSLKYRKGFFVLRDLAKIVRRSAVYRSFYAGAQLVPVPLHPLKERERGYNQTALIARMLAEVAGPPTTVAPILERVRWTDSQTQLSRKERASNMKNAFAIAKGFVVNPFLHHVVVDDVFTTGATINACCHALRTAGVRRLSVITIGHG